MKTKCPRCQDTKKKEWEDLGDIVWYRCGNVKCKFGWSEFKEEGEQYGSL